MMIFMSLLCNINSLIEIKELQPYSIINLSIIKSLYFYSAAFHDNDVYFLILPVYFLLHILDTTNMRTKCVNTFHYNKPLYVHIYARVRQISITTISI